MKRTEVFVSFFAILGILFSASTLSAQNRRGGNLPQPRNAQAIPQAQPVQQVPQAQPALQTQNTAASAVPTGLSDEELRIPEGATPEELFKKADALLNTERQFNTQEEYQKGLERIVQTAYQIAGKILSTPGIDDTTYAKAKNLQGEMIYTFGTIKPEVYSRYEKFVRSLPDDKRLAASEDGKNVIYSHQAGFLHWSCTRTVQQQGSAEEMKRYIDEFQTLLLAHPEYAEMVPDLVYPISEFANDKKDPNLFTMLLSDFVKALKGSGNEDLQKVSSGLEGMIRFSRLKGNPMTIAGFTPDGKKFDASPLKGKVVLVNFWATWATPCIAQYPELLALYMQYQDQGFEIVGYSVDEKVDELNDYISSKKLPWGNISAAVTQQQKGTLMTEFYGITAVPTLILIGKDGKVLETDLSIDQLKARLDELLK